MKKNSTIYSKSIAWRFYLLASILLIACLALLVRIVQLSIIERDFLVKKSQARVLRTVKIPAHRGVILDRNGHPLGISTAVFSIWANPISANISLKQLASLATLLKLPEANIKKNLLKPKREFTYLKRGVSPEIATKIKMLKIPGIFFQKEYKRYYPEGNTFAHVIGFTNIDNKGQEGLEQVYDKWLSGIAGKKQVLKDRLGHVIAHVKEIQAPQSGHNLTLSLDNRLQYLTYKSLAEAFKEYNVESASVVVLHAKTGEVLAMVNYPSYNPNHRPSKHDARYRNRAVTDVFEPGSTMKTFSLASALESKKYTPESLVDTGNGSIKVGRKVIKDLSKHGVIELKEVMKKSSEVGIIKVALSLPAQSLWKMFNRIGFGQKTESGFLGEASGSLVYRKKWRPIELATLSYGYGISVTALQLAQAYSILASNGKKHPVTFLKQNKAVTGEQILSPHISKQLLSVLEGVLEKGGTGYRARVKGYRVAGKTGTAYIAGKNGYNENRYTASFVGISPVSNPELVVAVVMHDVTGKKHFGAQVAAPVFAKIMKGGLNIMNIKPDAINEKMYSQLSLEH